MDVGVIGFLCKQKTFAGRVVFQEFWAEKFIWFIRDWRYVEILSLEKALWPFITNLLLNSLQRSR